MFGFRSVIFVSLLLLIHGIFRTSMTPRTGENSSIGQITSKMKIKKTILNFIKTPNSDNDEEVKEKKEEEGDEGMEDTEEEVTIVGTVMAMPGTDLRTQPIIANIKKENMTKVGANH